MKRIILLFAALLCLSPLASSQHRQGPPLPYIEITIPEIIDILSEYQILHENNPVFCQQFYGLTDFNARTIIICGYDLTARRRTLFHEILHVVYWKRGITTGGPFEVTISDKADRLFHKFYGLPPIDPTQTVPEIHEEK